jgi:hypothetical protein
MVYHVQSWTLSLVTYCFLGLELTQPVVYSLLIHLNGRAVDMINGLVAWKWNNKFHRIDGPAVLVPDINGRNWHFWWFNGMIQFPSEQSINRWMN